MWERVCTLCKRGASDKQQMRDRIVKEEEEEKNRMKRKIESDVEYKRIKAVIHIIESINKSSNILQEEMRGRGGVCLCVWESESSLLNSWICNFMEMKRCKHLHCHHIVNIIFDRFILFLYCFYMCLSVYFPRFLPLSISVCHQHRMYIICIFISL